MFYVHLIIPYTCFTSGSIHHTKGIPHEFCIGSQFLHFTSLHFLDWFIFNAFMCCFPLNSASTVSTLLTIHSMYYYPRYVTIYRAPEYRFMYKICENFVGSYINAYPNIHCATLTTPMTCALYLTGPAIPSIGTWYQSLWEIEISYSVPAVSGIQ